MMTSKFYSVIYNKGLFITVVVNSESYGICNLGHIP